MNRESKQAIASVTVGSSRGTGFLVGDAPPTVLTALHVIADIRGASRHDFDLAERWYAQHVQLSFGDPDDGATLGVDVKLSPETTLLSVEEDWALVTLDAPLPFAPLPTAGVARYPTGVPWSTFGYPQGAGPRGMTLGGQVRDFGRGQLYSHEAAAGAGLSVGGLSGGPCVVDGVALGVVFESLGDASAERAVNAGGTLFFRPIEVIYRRHPERLSRWGERGAGAPQTHLDALVGLLPAQFEVVVERLRRSGTLRPLTVAPSSLQRDRAEELITELARLGALDALSTQVRLVGGSAP